MAPMAGTGFAVDVKVCGELVPPPGVGFTTVIDDNAAVATFAAITAAVNCVELTYVVVRFDPFHCTCEAATKPVPVTVSVNAADPAASVDGEIDDTTGGGF